TISGFPTILHGFAAAALTLDRSEWPPLEHEALERTLANYTNYTEGRWTQLGIGMWNMRFALYGRKTVVEKQREIVEAALGAIPGAKIAFTTYQTPVDRPDVPIQDQVRAGIPKIDDMLAMLDIWKGRGRGGHVSFSPVTPFNGHTADTVYRRIWDRTAANGLEPVYSIIVRERSLIHVAMSMFDTGDAKRVNDAYRVTRELIDDVAEMGYLEYRAHSNVADLIREKFDFNDHALTRFYRTLKDGLDPNGILSPGKQGVWSPVNATVAP
ncbi:FAD-linked oxidase C-terminal domain-containing protein, partial [Streptomyces sp. NPDC002896]|uniref:FAD-linked oxidase C-terminal domain-containing protein n=1 Tax=Streptomyces sp. NPDC002896 TaxID=3154438 RepID=UPI003332335F